MSIGIAVISLLIFLGMFFFFLIFPAWMIIHCALAKERRVVSKVLWILVILVSWFLGSLVYGLFGARRALMRWLSLGILLSGVLIVLFLVHSLYQTSQMAADRSLKRAALLATGTLTQEQVAQMKERLLALSRDLDEAKGFKAFYLARRTYTDLMLNQIFITMMSDGQLLISEYQEWTQKFSERKQLDPQKLNAYLKSLQQDKKMNTPNKDGTR